MHLTSGVKLVQVPFPALGAYVSSSQTFRSAQEERRLQIEAQEHACCDAVVGRATPAQLKVLQAFAKGLKPQQVAEELAISPVTVHTHKTVLLTLCRQAWNIPHEESLDYLFLRDKFSGYFSTASADWLTNLMRKS